MQKKLIALAVAGAFAAPAFAATSNVDVYGIISMSVDYVSGDNGSNDNDLVTAKSNASRLGFKGSEDLGGGLSAIWQIETEFLSGTGNNGAGYNDFRNTFVGLKGGFGTVLMGRHDTPYKLATGKLDPFADTVGDYNAIIGSSPEAGFGSSYFDLRVGQTLAYISPTVSGFHAAVAYVGVKNQEAAGVDNMSAWSAMAMYDQGPFFASLAYEKHNGSVIAPGADSGDEQTAWKLGLGFTFGNTLIGGIYERQRDNDTHSHAEHNAWYLSAKHQMGNIALKASYARAGDIDTHDDSGASMWALGADYSLSKRTTVYAVYAKLDNDDNQNENGYRLFGEAATGAGNSPSALSLGIKHSF